MDPTAFVQAVRERLHPNPYAGLLQAGGPFGLILARSCGRLAHDVLAVIELKSPGDAAGLVEQAREDIAARFGTLLFRREVVLHLIVHAPMETWKDALGALVPDRLGFRGVMVQSVYVVDPATGAGHKSVSKWGPFRLSRRNQEAAEAAREVVASIEPLVGAPEA